MQTIQRQNSNFLGSKVALPRSARSAGAPQKLPFRQRQGAVTVKSFLSETNVVIGLSTLGSVLLGRYVFLPTHKKYLSIQGLPKQNGVTHAEAGDARAVENGQVIGFQDGAGFTLIEAISYGALGHAVGYAILALAPFKVWPYNY